MLRADHSSREVLRGVMCPICVIAEPPKGRPCPEIMSKYHRKKKKYLSYDYVSPFVTILTCRPTIVFSLLFKSCLQYRSLLTLCIPVVTMYTVTFHVLCILPTQCTYVPRVLSQRLFLKHLPFCTYALCFV